MKNKIGLESFKKEVTLERLEKDANKISITSNKSDHISYPEFLKYFADLKTITRHDVIIGINFCYAWMPTMFDFCSDISNEVISILNRAKTGQIPTERELEMLRGCFNNSLVGTSKLLHFINPKVFAIWDNRVLGYLTRGNSNTYQLKKPKTYLEFLEFCRYITSQKEYNKIHDLVVKKSKPWQNDEISIY